ncbi:MAG TPA: glycerophosphodiester phosphodiesterase family protein [Methylomirabilota bacterium]|jgi:glycerophosphoryl diester phosphodiesterase|nr:glycerophosphodiester phosphodiesterase family protein [Methylomirabilota bacterium]
MTLVVAHRGAPAIAPENTMEAYRLAVEMGADALELDVHLTADGKLAVIHDETAERTTDLTGAIASMTMKQLRTADAGYRFEAPEGSFPFRGKGLKVPTLPEVLKWLPAGIGLVVEVKARAATAPTIAALRGSRVREEGAVSIISFDERAIEESRALDPEIPTGYLLVPSQPIEAALAYAVEHGHAAVHPWDGDLGLDPSAMLQEATAYGRLIGCYVVNEPDRMRQLAALGLWGFVTDLPDVGRQALGPRAG